MEGKENSSIPENWIRGRESLRKKIERCFESNPPQPVNLSLSNHAVITLTLQTLVYNRQYQDKELPVIFMDSSKPAAFPIGCLSPGVLPQSLQGLPLVRLGLMSFRHPEMDYLVDLYITQNRELAAEASMADEEALSYQRTVELLKDSALDDGGVIELYHTGLEPMVVGCYRGIVQILQERIAHGLPRSLVICPKLFHPQYRMEENQKGLTRQSPGAVPEHYVSSEQWI